MTHRSHTHALADPHTHIRTFPCQHTHENVITQAHARKQHRGIQLTQEARAPLAATSHTYTHVTTHANTHNQTHTHMLNLPASMQACTNAQHVPYAPAIGLQLTQAACAAPPALPTDCGTGPRSLLQCE
jgi:hypothetical protein